MLKEAMIIVPKFLNDGMTPTRPERAVLVYELIKAFGGFTVTEGVGYWKRPDGAIQSEPVYQYSVALDVDTPDQAEMLFSLACQYVGRDMKQESVYVRLPTEGNVRFATKGKDF